MKSSLYYSYFLLILLVSCKSLTTSPLLDSTSKTISRLRFIDELIIRNDFIFEETNVGGLSGIDYYNEHFFLLSDDRKVPRFYQVKLPVSLKGFGTILFEKMTVLNDVNGLTFKNGNADPESLRIINDKAIIWSSEGNRNAGINAFIRTATLEGDFSEEVTLPNRYLLQETASEGPRNNGVFEALSVDYDGKGYWIATELPLLQDGDAPTVSQASSKVRIAYIEGKNLTFKKEFAYPLDKVARPGKLEVNGITEILSYDTDKMLVLERSYASGYDDGGNDVKIYSADLSQASDVSAIDRLTDGNYSPVNKKLLLDFNTLRDKLDDGLIDNIEGLTFGPLLSNGKRSLIVISDNNFNAFGKQKTQLLLFEIR